MKRATLRLLESALVEVRSKAKRKHQQEGWWKDTNQWWKKDNTPTGLPEERKYMSIIARSTKKSKRLKREIKTAHAQGQYNDTTVVPRDRFYMPYSVARKVEDRANDFLEGKPADELKGALKARARRQAVSGGIVKGAKVAGAAALGYGAYKLYKHRQAKKQREA